MPLSSVPFFRPSIGEAEIDEVVRTLRAGWLTTGPRVRQFEEKLAVAVGAKHAVALNSCTAALHLALEALGVTRGDRVIVPTMTFAATAEVVRYFDAVPVFVDCDPETLCPDPESVRRVLEAAGPAPKAFINLHYGGQVGDFAAITDLAKQHGFRLVEDAAHTMPAEFRRDARSPWQRVGANADVTCFSFYANKCITTGEGGMATTDDEVLAQRMRLMSLHGMDRDAWKRYTAEGSWYYEIVAPGFKYNMTELAGAMGLVQLGRLDELWAARREAAAKLTAALEGTAALELPRERPDRRHSWHLYSVKLRLDRLRIDRNRFLDELKRRGVGHSVHWQPLHMMPYYRERYGFAPSDFPVAAGLWPRLLSLPLFAGMTDEEIACVAATCKSICREYAS